jgi:hypothetical protein
MIFGLDRVKHPKFNHGTQDYSVAELAIPKIIQ